MNEKSNERYIEVPEGLNLRKRQDGEVLELIF